ncbi:MAG: pyruvate kinase [Opitutales bacterium]|nr:pyruvate kinase [Opitutales bacterium]
MPNHFRQTKIIFTIGPATQDVDTLESLISEGVDVCRFNMAHASVEWVKKTVANIREAGQKAGRSVALLMDVKGPEIRTGDLPAPLMLSKGDVVDFILASGQAAEPGIPQVSVNYPKLITDLKVGDSLLVDSGMIRLKVIQKLPSALRCKTETGGSLGSRRHINLPGVRVDLPSLTNKDRKDVEFGVELGFDYFALSFVREAADIELLRRFLIDHHSKARIVAKIEDQQAISNLESIIRASDGLMIARGDLGIECPFEELPVIQKRSIALCNQYCKPAIVATHMLESMITAPIPTRAEVTDVSNAVLERADCVMLSGETSVGKYPLECIRVLKRIVERTEETIQTRPSESVRLETPAEKMLRSAAHLASEVDGSGLVVFTRGMRYPLLLSALRASSIPIYAFTDDEALFRQMTLVWGVEPFFMTYTQDREESIQNALLVLKSKAWVQSGDRLVVVTNVLARSKVVESIQLRHVE